MNADVKTIILKVTGAEEIIKEEVIQNLWSNYGQIIRISLSGSKFSSVILKHIQYGNPGSHARGWNTSLSHNRKVKSYQVETAWYQQYGSFCSDSCRIPKCLAIEKIGDDVLLMMEDLNAAGYPVRKSTVNWNEMKACISWLANFHVTFMEIKPKGLWETGTYWHLETRPDELAVLKDLPLKNAASIIDHKLKSSPFQTLVHGDAKLANFCFSKDGEKVAAVDFQYAGAGVGVKDLAYFIGSCLDEEESERLEEEMLNHYFSELKKALERNQADSIYKDLEEDWRGLFYVAWADFHRFLKGWSPGHWKINSYSEKISRRVIQDLQMGKMS